MTSLQKSYIQNMSPDDSYKFYNQKEDGSIRLLHKNNRKTLTLSVDDLKFLIDNELITVEDLNITAAGRIAIMPGVKHSINKDKLTQFKGDIQKELDIQKEERLKQLQEEHRAKVNEEIRKKSIERSNLFKAIKGLWQDFKRPNSNKHFKETKQPKQQVVPQPTGRVQPVQARSIQRPSNVNAIQSSSIQRPSGVNSSQYAQSMNNPNLDNNLR